MRSIWKRDVVAPLGLSLIALGAANQLAVDLGWIALGDEPGEGPGLLETALVAAGWFAILVVAVFYLVGRLRSEERVVWAEPLLAPAAAAYMVAVFHSFDPYFLPDLQRYSENDFVQPAWVYGLAGVAVVAGLWTFRAPQSGLRATALVLFAVLLTTVLIPGGK
jgi:hypothetical protein